MKPPTDTPKAADDQLPAFFSPRLYRGAGYVAIGCILLGVVLALVLIWGESDALAPWLGRLAATVAVLFLGSVLVMAFASVTPRDPFAGRHRSFRLTRSGSPRGDRDPDG